MCEQNVWKLPESNNIDVPHDVKLVLMLSTLLSTSVKYKLALSIKAVKTSKDKSFILQSIQIIQKGEMTNTNPS